ncbi:MAG TPA: hypothetical protein VK634_19690 [Reyranella sp.]|nr:hypothetical protein [Reyranella sp.]HTE82918.1 hypothetical protein [Reyranella sp.]
MMTAHDTLVEQFARIILKTELEEAAVDLVAEGKADARTTAMAALSGVEKNWRLRVPLARAILQAIDAAGFKLEPPSKR